MIHGITVGRSPVQSAIRNFLQMATHKVAYDTLFHLYIIFHTNHGDVLCEKNEVIHFQLHPHPKGEKMEVKYPPQHIQGLLYEKPITESLRKQFLACSEYGKLKRWKGTGCCLKTGSPVVWYDSFGFPPPLEVMKLVGDRGIIFNDKDIQDERSTACG